MRITEKQLRERVENLRSMGFPLRIDHAYGEASVVETFPHSTAIKEASGRDKNGAVMMWIDGFGRGQYFAFGNERNILDFAGQSSDLDLYRDACLRKRSTIADEVLRSEQLLSADHDTLMQYDLLLSQLVQITTQMGILLTNAEQRRKFWPMSGYSRDECACGRGKVTFKDVNDYTKWVCRQCAEEATNADQNGS